MSIELKLYNITDTFSPNFSVHTYYISYTYNEILEILFNILVI